MKDLYDAMNQRHTAFYRGYQVRSLDRDEERYYRGDDPHPEGAREWERKHWEDSPAHELGLIVTGGTGGEL